MPRSFISNSVSNQDGAKISKSLTKSIQRFYMPSKSVMKFHIMKLTCFIESKKITVFLMNLNRNCNIFRWKMKIIFGTSKRRLKDVLSLSGRTDQFWTYKRRSVWSRADWEIIYSTIIKTNFPRSDNMLCVKNHTSMYLVAKLAGYFPTRHATS